MRVLPLSTRLEPAQAWAGLADGINLRANSSKFRLFGDIRMTFVGKVLVVVQVFLSLCFMAFAGAVYTVQQDWKAAHEKKVAAVQAKDNQLRERDEQISFLNKDLAASQAIQEDIQIYLDRNDELLSAL